MYCMNCGEELPSSANFCKKCGKDPSKVAGSESSSQKRELKRPKRFIREIEDEGDDEDFTDIDEVSIPTDMFSAEVAKSTTMTFEQAMKTPHYEVPQRKPENLGSTGKEIMNNLCKDLSSKDKPREIS